MLAAALFGLTIAVSQTTLTYMLPPVGDDGFATSHTAWFVPAVVASVVGAVTVLVLAAWAALVHRRTRSRFLWLAVVAVTVVDLVVLVVTTGTARPDF